MAMWHYGKAFYFTRAEKVGKIMEDVPWLKVEFGSRTKLYKGENVQLVLDEMGEEGWELVSTTPIIGVRGAGSGASIIAGLMQIQPGPTGNSETLGVMMWFKKRIDDNRQ